MKCPVCGSDLRPSKKYPGKYLCDHCRKRFPASSVITDSEAHSAPPRQQTSSEQISKGSQHLSPDSNRQKSASSKKKRKAPWLVILIVLLVLLGAGLLFKFFYLDKAAASSPASKEDIPSSSRIYQAGETADFNGIQITLNDYEESAGDEWNLPAEGNEFVFVHMTLTNQSSSDNDLVVSSMANFENYCDDTKLDYSASAFTALATTSDYQKLDGTLSPGETLDGYLSLEVPSNWSTIKIRYSNKVWSEETVSFQITR